MRRLIVGIGIISSNRPWRNRRVNYPSSELDFSFLPLGMF